MTLHKKIRQQLASDLFDQSHEGIMITDANGTIIDVNDAFVRITGYSRKEAIGQDTRLLKSGAQDQEFYNRMWEEIRKSGYWRGEIWNRKKSGELFPELLSISAVRGADEQIEHYVAIFLDITEIKEKEEELRRLAHFDSLTGLPNRTLAMDRLRQNMSRAQRNGQLLAAAYIDLDGFKEINDTVGHHGGDHILIEIARRMKKVLRGGDSIARLGGDEFMAMVTDLRSPDDVDAFINRFFDSIRQPIEFEGQQHRISASVGIAFYPQKRDVDAETLVQQADQAMYQSKLAGKDQYCVFHADIESYSRGRNALIGQMRDGLRRNEFELYVQPKVNMRDGTIIGVESLIRWQHPELGLMEPGLFLPKLLGHELEIELGWWGIDTALAQMAKWQKMDTPMPISVNISALHLQQPQFIDGLKSRIQKYPQLPPNSLELEILETSALNDLHSIGRLIDACSKIGVQFSVDDFGTGYSTLLMLRHLPAQFLKIDRSFIQNLLTESNDLILMESMIALGRAFGRRIIAEGVETELQAELLLRLGCELAQGYCIARPMPISELFNWIAHWQRPARWGKAPPLDPSKLKLLHGVIRDGIWIQQLEQFLAGESTAAPEFSAQACEFSYGLQEIGLKASDHPLAASLIKTHEELHSLAHNIITLAKSGQKESAIGQVTELKAKNNLLLQTWLDLSDQNLRSC